MISRMIDVTETFVRARERGAWPIETLVDAVPSDPNLDGMRVEWDPDADEDWMRVLKTSMVLALVWVPARWSLRRPDITRSWMRSNASRHNVEQVAVPHLDSPVLTVRAGRLDDIWPSREWPEGAVDPACLSAHDLWYATC